MTAADMPARPASSYTLDEALADAAREVDALLSRQAPQPAPTPAPGGVARRLAVATTRQEMTPYARRTV